jgi:hypothetical protein
LFPRNIIGFSNKTTYCMYKTKCAELRPVVLDMFSLLFSDDTPEVYACVVNDISRLYTG